MNLPKYLPLILFVGSFFEASAQDLALCLNVAAPTISTEKTMGCSGQSVLLKADNCDGSVVWSNKKMGNAISDFPNKTTIYTAYCKKENCRTADSKPLTVEVIVPRVPVLSTTQKEICLGQSATLTAIGCSDEVVWSNGMKGSEITVSPILTTKYTASCNSQGCFSCFATEVEVKVSGNEVLKLSTTKPAICEGENVSIVVAGNYTGKVKWADGAEGKEIIVKPSSTTTYSAYIESANGCVSLNKSDITIQVGAPLPPKINSSKQTICYTESATLTAEGCDGVVRWSDGSTGNSIVVTNNQFLENTTLNYTATCRRGECESVEATKIALTLIRKVRTPSAESELVNTCPFVSVDLSSAVKSKLSHEGAKFVFHTAERADAPIVENTGAVSVAGVYYLEELAPSSCGSMILPIVVKIMDCANPIATCINNPAKANIIASDRTASGNFFLQGKVSGAAVAGLWSSNGSGSFSNSNGLSTIYTPSNEDYRAGKISVNFSTEDPDGTGPCKAGNSLVDLKFDNSTASPAENAVAGNIKTDSTALKTNASSSASEPDIFIPEGFSPNGDGINDNFVIRHNSNSKISIEIYNRWGAVVYKNEDYKNDWNGINGLKKERLPDGSYFYSVKLSDGREFSKFLTISR